ncbi:MAG: glycosyltransferase family 4 protein [Candidatus Omnitrophota bacterium]
MSIKIINILPDAPWYDGFRHQPRPAIHWDTAQGQWVGIWGADWPDLIGKEVLKLTDQFDYEVWQPDLGADNVYSHRFENGLIHRLFPASLKREFYGIKIKGSIVCPRMVEAMKRETKVRCIIHLNGDLASLFNLHLISNIGHFPTIHSLHGMYVAPNTEMVTWRKNILANMSHFLNYRKLKRHVANIDWVTAQNRENLEYLARIGYQGQIERITMGCDFDFWRPENQEEAKKEFSINPETRVFSMASRFAPLKRIDRIIEVFTDIHKKYSCPFKLMVAGHGNQGYENYLYNLSQSLMEAGKLQFTGYLNDPEMLRLYRASDFFISPSKAEGAPVSVMKALACEVPVITTPIGGTYEVMAQHGAGKVIDPMDYSKWKDDFINVLSGEKVNILDREIAKTHFHWPNIAEKFIAIYQKLATL